MNESKKYDVFLAYANENFKKVEEVYKGLVKRGLSVWWDHENLTKGKWKPQITNAIAKSRHPKSFDIIYALLEIKNILHRYDVALGCSSINDLFDANKLSQIKKRIGKPNNIIGESLALRIQSYMNEKVTLNFLEKLKKGGVVFPVNGND